MHCDNWYMLADFSLVFMPYLSELQNYIRTYNDTIQRKNGLVGVSRRNVTFKFDQSVTHCKEISHGKLYYL